MRILTVLTYYRPHTSGLTIYAERIARALAARGHEVTVLTSRYRSDLPREEVSDGVRVIRLPVAARVSKGVLVPSFGWVALREVLRHDVVLLHLPQFDAAGVALRGRLLRRPTAILYHCDLQLPPGGFNRVVNRLVDLMNHLAALFAHRVVAYTEDYARHSRYLERWRAKREVILPPVELPEITAAAVGAFARPLRPERRPVIGMATRLAAEKGVEVLLAALPALLERFPRLQLWFAGQHEGVWGEEEYAAQLQPAIGTHVAAGRWHFLGVLAPEQMAAFFSHLDLLVVPSLNSTESFGLVQIEAMMRGTPVVASDLPGVRQPVTMTGMGRIVPVGDAAALAAAIREVLERPEAFRGDPAAISEQFSPARSAAAWEDLFEQLLGRLRGRGGAA